MITTVAATILIRMPADCFIGQEVQAPRAPVKEERQLGHRDGFV
jgi:hypothetical protein